MSRSKKFQAPIKKESPTLERKANLAEDLRVVRAQRQYWELMANEEKYRQARAEIEARLAKVQAELNELDAKHATAGQKLADLTVKEQGIAKAVKKLVNFKQIKKLQELAAKAVEAQKQLAELMAEENGEAQD